MEEGTGCGEPWSVSAPWAFRDTAYTVSADVRNEVLVVQVEEKLTAEQWRGQFEAKHIEELTRKTGNYKQFAVFLNMLESAITKSSDSVILDLLTYADLEALKSRKPSGKSHRSPAKTAKQLQSKRYLILTYSVEFDRIHYPLALPYTGKPDPALLQKTIKRLRTELDRQRKHDAQQGQKHSSLARLQREYDSLLLEKEELEATFDTFRREVMSTREGNASKEIRILKKVIKNLEEDIMKERTKHQRTVGKKNDEIRTLLQELEELRSSERTLRTRVKSLTNELAVLKRGMRCSPSLRSKSSTSTVKKSSSAHVRRRSSSADRHQVASGTLPRSRIRTPSPSGARVPRFDPTAYVQSRRRRQQDTDLRLGRMKVSTSRRTRSRSNSIERPPRIPKPSPQPHSGDRRPGGTRGHRRSRTSSVGSGSSRGSSRRSSVDLSGSGSSGILITAGNRGSGSAKFRSRTSGGSRRVRSGVHVWDSPTADIQASSTPAHHGNKRLSKPSKLNDSGPMNHSAEISEIDARLNALQQFMKRSLESTGQHHT